jgi:hypothetical protein
VITAWVTEGNHYPRQPSGTHGLHLPVRPFGWVVDVSAPGVWGNEWCGGQSPAVLPCPLSPRPNGRGEGGEGRAAGFWSLPAPVAPIPRGLAGRLETRGLKNRTFNPQPRVDARMQGPNWPVL